MSNELKRKGLILCLVGVVGSGKTSLGSKLVSEFSPHLQLSVSATSRVPREGEVEGKSYYFLSRTEFEKRASDGEFFEWEETHGNLYGTLKSTIETAISSGNDLLLDVDIRGALNFKRAYSKATEIVFIFPPSEEELLSRVRKRGEMPPEELQIRLKTARNELDFFWQDVSGDRLIRYILENDKFDETYEKLRSIYLSEQQVLDRVAIEELDKYRKLFSEES